MLPSDSAGKNVSAPTTTTTATSSTANVDPLVGKVPRLGGTTFFPTIDPAMARAGTTISPAMNTVSTTKINIPYRPAPVPPNTTSPSWMLTSGTSPPSGVKLSCMAFTAPQEASVVTVAYSADVDTPKRASLPSMLPRV